MTTRKASISRSGAAVFLTETDLQEIGINPDSDSLSYEIEEGQITLTNGETA